MPSTGVDPFSGIGNSMPGVKPTKTSYPVGTTSPDGARQVMRAEPTKAPAPVTSGAGGGVAGWTMAVSGSVGTSTGKADDAGVCGAVGKTGSGVAPGAGGFGAGRPAPCPVPRDPPPAPWRPLGTRPRAAGAVEK